LGKSNRRDDGDDSAFKDDLVELIPFLRAFARTLCGDTATADDLAQETLLKAWKSRRQFEPGTNLKAWTYMILRNHFYSEKRRAWRQAAWDDEKAERTLTAASDQAAVLELDELRRALAELPPEQREALMLVGAAGFAYDEAARICGCAVGTIKSRVNRARKALEAIHDSGAFARSSEDPVAAEGAMEAILEEAHQIAHSDGRQQTER
jgi:RNA polymerase sigma-70 factor (ECF subfamily)